MKRAIVFAVAMSVAFSLVACKKKPAPAEEKQPTPSGEMKPAMEEPARPASDMATEAARPKPPEKRPVELKEVVPTGESIAEHCAKAGDKKDVGAKGKLKKHKKMQALIMAAGTKCTELDEAKCKEYKALKQFVNDVWMNKIKLKKEERLDAYGTAIDLLLHANKKVATCAVQGVINGYLYRHEWVAEKPELLPRKYIMKMIKAVSNMERPIDMGFIVQDVAQLAPAYGLTGEVFKVATEHLGKNKSLVSYALTNMVTFGDVCLFDHIKSNAKDTKNFLVLAAAAQAMNALLKKKLTPKHTYEICTFSDQLVPEKFSDEQMKNWDFRGFGYRYFDVVKTCKRYQALEKVGYFAATQNKDLKKQADKVTEELRQVKKSLEDKAAN